MSGPITTGYILVHTTLAVVAEALRQARELQRDYAEVLAQLQQRECDNASAREQHRAARLERLSALHADAARKAARDTQLRELAGALGVDVSHVGAAPAAPNSAADDAAWSTYLAGLDAVVTALEHALAARAATGAAQLRAVLAAGKGGVPTINDVLSGYVLQRQARAGLATDDAEQFCATAARVLGRLTLAEGQALPAALAALARAIVMAPSVARAEALASELRRAVQHADEAHRTRATAMVDARALLAQLPAAAPAELLQALELAAIGSQPLDDALRSAVQDVVDALAVEREHDEQRAAALVLEESLRDLGYDVADIEATLFVDGGSVHFRRAGWDNYFVRMRVAPQDKTAHFNVVRSRGAEDTAERRRQDTLAEDRWCSEFPKLLDTLAARGLQLAITRRLEAGEVPVQTVDPASLPTLAAHDDDAAATPVLRQRPLG